MRPRVSINMAISLDGKISTHAYTPARFTSSEDSQRLLELRAPADALLVGRGTLESDTMRMTVPEEVLQQFPERSRKAGPLRCVVSHSGVWDSDHPVFSLSEPAVLLYHTGDSVQQVEGVEQIHVEGVLDLLEDLYRRGVKHLHCEGGGQLLKELFDEDLIDEINLTWAAGKLFGGKDAPSLTGEPGMFLRVSRHFKLLSIEPVGETGEVFLLYARA